MAERGICRSASINRTVAQIARIPPYFKKPNAQRNGHTYGGGGGDDPRIRDGGFGLEVLVEVCVPLDLKEILDSDEARW
jgi:hypothetical protein